MRDCHRFNKDGTPIKNRGGESKPLPNKKMQEGTNIAQVVRTKSKKALCKHMRKDKKRHTSEAESDNNSDEST